MDDGPSHDPRASDAVPGPPSPRTEGAAAGFPVPSPWPGRIVVGLTVLALLGAGILLLGARSADDRTRAARRDTVQIVAGRHRVRALTERVGHTADGPIGVAEKVSTSVSRIIGATGPVIEAANAAQDRLAEAVDVANGGNPDGARALYTGPAAQAIDGMRTLLAGAQSALATARAAALELAAQAS